MRYWLSRALDYSRQGTIDRGWVCRTQRQTHQPCNPSRPTTTLTGQRSPTVTTDVDDGVGQFEVDLVFAAGCCAHVDVPTLPAVLILALDLVNRSA